MFGIFGLYWDYIGIMEKKMETAIVYLGYIGIIGFDWGTFQVFRVHGLG